MPVEITEKSTRGGARRGAGRPVVPLPAYKEKQVFTLRLPLWLIKTLREKFPDKHRSKAVEDALIKHFKLVPPYSQKGDQ